MFKTDINPIYIEIAKHIMENIQNDCGAANRFEGGFKYPKHWVKVIAKHSQTLFEKYPEILTDDFLNDISCRGEEIRAKINIKYPEFRDLDIVLDRYFESL